MRIKFFRPRTTARLRFRQVGKSSSSGRSRKSQRRFQSLSAYFNIQHWPDHDDLLSLVDTRNRSPRPGMAGVHKNTKGLRCPSFRSLTKSLDTFLEIVAELREPNSPEPCRPTCRRSTETGQRQSASVSWPQTAKIVGGRFQMGRQKTPPVEFCFET
jgi:hypothetical protein